MVVSVLSLSGARDDIDKTAVKE